MAMGDALNFIEHIVEEDIRTDKNDGRVLTRFPPEPNGYLHIGHAKSICLNFGLAEKYGGLTNLRFDDTNPAAEETEYVESIKEDIQWLGFDWEDREFYASDYFDQLYEFAEQLIRDRLAYVDDSTSEEIAALKGTPTKPGTHSPYRERSVEENLKLFREMRDGIHEEGTKSLRAKVDMASPNMLMRDPIIYRVKKVPHHRTGDKWNIYPMYDFAHGQSDSIEKITHSICTLEFENHRPLYDWFIEKLGIFPSRQIEFARLNLSYTIMSKRRLLILVNEGYVTGWDDPRMPTISGLRRRGYTPESIRDFATRVGIAKRNNVIDLSLLEFSGRSHLNKIANRAMVVLDPIKLVITNYPEGQKEELPAINNPEDETAGSRMLPFGRELFIERTDFMEDAPKKFYRLSPGRNVRLKHAYIIHCEGFVADSNGFVQEVHCTYYPETKSGQDKSGIKSKGTLHWVACDKARDVKVRLYDRLFNEENPLAHEGKDFIEFLNPESLKVIEHAKMEPNIPTEEVGAKYQFLRTGYFTIDKDSASETLVFNRTVTLKDSWKKIQNK
ncbi:MAG: glutamine--tRNA ligase/YqeY domain fusion protein [Bacteroidia bacterium]|nr:glutamine--tRNA ligase/YqeY domain fusion protein [Bacteroidia bacterium]